MITVNNREDFLRECKKMLHSNIDAVEIGVYRGDFARKIYDILCPYYLLLIDPFEEGKERYIGALYGQKIAYSNYWDLNHVVQIFKDEIKEKRVDVDVRLSHEAVERYEHDSFDFIYIDANHEYPAIKQDLNDWLPKLTINGLLCGHDMLDIEGFGVLKAVNEFIKEQNLELVIFNSSEGDYALKRKS